ncbi:uncharacterized protein ACA1_103880 [Acanthamoeba castellanii str. Neff]|uniref:F-box domain-containing protein n=1 Tax=Acanthamoeba castellanii (strain ATCC 30010 / Neff) TaxID=1257118 RepID=L8GCS3_ACACF|nr:uncharacterized protein ACA1_103880 [Acanthamoeba castellanii str. Neff]ELR10980.1 hypothetical protein ACA1_103880 [Acanthamoeba castellanii str. Neff]
MEFDGYRGADDVEEEVRNVGEGTDLFTHYAIGLPILMRIFSYLDVHSLRRVVLVNRAWYGHNKDRLTESHDVERSLHVCDYLSYVVQSHIKELKLKDQAYIAAKKNKACPPATNDPSWFCQKNASLFTSDPLVEYNPTDNTIDYVNATIDLLRQYLKLQAVRQQQKKRMGLNDKEEQERRAFLTQLLKIMNTQLRDTILALSDILSGRTKWNSNFEIFELSIRRYYEQLRVRTCPRGKLQQRRKAGGERDAVLMIRWRA